MSCANATEPAGRKGKGKGKGKGKKCPTVEEAQAWFVGEFSEELCVFYELGWLDSEGNFDNVTSAADLSSLPATVTEAVSEDNMEQCMGKVIKEMSEEKKMKKCGKVIKEMSEEKKM